MNIESKEWHQKLKRWGLQKYNRWLSRAVDLGLIKKEDVPEIDSIENELTKQKYDDSFYRKQMTEWKKEPENKEFMIAIYRDKIREYKEDYKAICDKDYKNDKEKNMPYSERKLFLLMSGKDKIEKKIKDYAMRLRVLEYCGKGKIDPDMIVRAREYPIENIIEPKRGYIVCPYHDDHAPSMWVKNNFGYCFSCGAHADAIDLMQKLNGLNFIEAVRRMQ